MNEVLSNNSESPAEEGISAKSASAQQQNPNKPLGMSYGQVLSLMSEKGQYDQVNVRIPMELNDWINETMRQSKRLHGTKILKEEIITVAICLLRSQDIDWTLMRNRDDLLQAVGLPVPDELEEAPTEG